MHMYAVCQDIIASLKAASAVGKSTLLTSNAMPMLTNCFHCVAAHAYTDSTHADWFTYVSVS